MTEQDYEKLVSEAAKGQGKVFAEHYPTMNGRKPHREDVLEHAFSIGLKAGVAFARANPAPEVLELVEALKKYSRASNINGWSNRNAEIAESALTRFKERARKLADALKLFIARCTDEDMKDAFRLGRQALKDWEDGK